MAFVWLVGHKISLRILRHSGPDSSAAKFARAPIDAIQCAHMACLPCSWQRRRWHLLEFWLLTPPKRRAFHSSIPDMALPFRANRPIRILFRQSCACMNFGTELLNGVISIHGPSYIRRSQPSLICYTVRQHNLLA